MVSHAQTVEDGAPRDQPKERVFLDGTPGKYKRVLMTVRAPSSRGVEAQRLVIRAYRYEGEITLALQALRVEEPGKK